MATHGRRSSGVWQAVNDDYPSKRNWKMWQDAPLLEYISDPSIGHRHLDHFHTFRPSDWTITTVETGFGAATETITDYIGGLLQIYNDGADDDSDELQHVGAAWLLAPGCPLWGEFKMMLIDDTNSDFWLGLSVTDTTLITGAANALWFQKDDDVRDVRWHTDDGGSTTEGDTGFDVDDMLWDYYGLKYDGVGRVEFWINNVLRGSAETDINEDDEMRISFGLRNGVGKAKIMWLDYIDFFQAWGTS